MSKDKSSSVPVNPPLKRAFGNCDKCHRVRCAIWLLNGRALCRTCRDAYKGPGRPKSEVPTPTLCRECNEVNLHAVTCPLAPLARRGRIILDSERQPLAEPRPSQHKMSCETGNRKACDCDLASAQRRWDSERQVAEPRHAFKIPTADEAHRDLEYVARCAAKDCGLSREAEIHQVAEPRNADDDLYPRWRDPGCGSCGGSGYTSLGGCYVCQKRYAESQVAEPQSEALLPLTPDEAVTQVRRALESLNALPTPAEPEIAKARVILRGIIGCGIALAKFEPQDEQVEPRCVDCGHKRDNPDFHLEAVGTNWGAALHRFREPDPEPVRCVKCGHAQVPDRCGVWACCCRRDFTTPAPASPSTTQQSTVTDGLPAAPVGEVAGALESPERAWLLERNQTPDGPEYLSVDAGTFTWTTDNLKALRLARREDADSLAEIINDCQHVREHQWG